MNWKTNLLINALGRVGSILTIILFTPLFVRMLGLEAFSLAAFFLTLIGLIFMFDYAFGATTTRELARYAVLPDREDDARDLVRSLEYLYVGIGSCMALACILAAPWIAAHWLKVQSLPYSSVRTSIMLMGLCIGLQAPMGMYIGGLYGLERQKTLNIAQFSLGVARYGGAAFAMWVVAATPVVFFAWQFAFTAVQTVVMRHLLWMRLPKGRRPARFNLPILRGIFQFTSKVVATAIVSMVINQLDKIVLSRLLPLPMLGVYQIGNQLSNGMRLLPNTVANVLLPRLSAFAAGDQEPALRRVYHEACQIVALFTLPLGATLAFYSHPILLAWLGNAAVAEKAAPITTILILGSTLNGLVQVQAGVALAKGWSSFGMYESLISGFFFIPVLFFMAIHHGVIGAALTWLMLNIGYVVIDPPIIHWYMLRGEYRRWLLQDTAVPFAISFGCVAAIWTLVPTGGSLHFKLGAAALSYGMAASLCVAAMPATREITLNLVHRLRRKTF